MNFLTKLNSFALKQHKKFLLLKTLNNLEKAIYHEKAQKLIEVAGFWA